jgi:ferric-dicitrate binding protein FerR (iron transport regulator)
VFVFVSINGFNPLMFMKDAKDLIEKYKLGICTPEEKQIIESWFHHLGEHDISDFTEEELLASRERLHSNMLELITSSTPGSVWKRYLSAAAILIFVSFSIFFFLKKQTSIVTKDNSNLVNDIQPGNNKAVLTLADGKKISLDDFGNGEIAEQQGIKVIKSSDGQLIYTLSNPKDFSNSTLYNTIETPMGGQYQVNLPDGSKAWLNSGSYLRYPVKFSGKERKIEISGEVYFEVAKIEGIPFKVQAGEQTIEVLGTHFNVMAYTDEASINTTLVEGSVKVTNGEKSTIIIPGQQSRLKNGEFEVLSVDIDEVIAWKNGFFVFKNENLKSMMRKISRWYDVEVVYQGNIVDKSFGGKISRSRNISELLKILESTGSIHFEVVPESSESNERRVIVMP